MEAPDDPPLVRAFWAALGWSDVLRGNDLAPPERAAGLARIDDLLASYRSDSFTLDRADLPERTRLVGADDGGVGFSITDEDADADDPPVRVVLFDDDAVVDGSDSYVCWCANAVVRRAFASGTSAMLRSRGVPAGRQPFPSCSPLTAELADGVWSVPASPELRSPGDAVRLSCTIDALVAWLERIAADDIVLEHLGPTRTAMTDGDAAPAGFVPLGGLRWSAGLARTRRGGPCDRDRVVARDEHFELDLRTPPDGTPLFDDDHDE